MVFHFHFHFHRQFYYIWCCSRSVCSSCDRGHVRRQICTTAKLIFSSPQTTNLNTPNKKQLTHSKDTPLYEYMPIHICVCGCVFSFDVVANGKQQKKKQEGNRRKNKIAAVATFQQSQYPVHRHALVCTIPHVST